MRGVHEKRNRSYLLRSNSLNLEIQLLGSKFRFGSPFSFLVTLTYVRIFRGRARSRWREVWKVVPRALERFSRLPKLLCGY